jgi:hypothetical protein
MHAVWRILLGILKEISDESAYARHLAHHRRTHSGEEWRKFCEERLRGKYQQSRCC